MVATVLGSTIKELMFDLQQRRVFCSPTHPNPLGPTQCTIQWVPHVKLLGHEADNSPPSRLRMSQPVTPLRHILS